MHGCWSRGYIRSVWTTPILKHRSLSAHSTESFNRDLHGNGFLFDTANVGSNKCMTMNMSSFELGRLPLIIANRRSSLRW